MQVTSTIQSQKYLMFIWLSYTNYKCLGLHIYIYVPIITASQGTSSLKHYVKDVTYEYLITKCTKKNSLKIFRPTPYKYNRFHVKLKIDLS